MPVNTIPVQTWLALGVSGILSLWVVVLVWRRDDPLLLKVIVTLLTWVPFFGPIFGLWIVIFPSNKMPPEMQARYKNAVNVYNVPKAAIESGVRREIEARAAGKTGEG